MPSSETFSIPPIAQFIGSAISSSPGIWVDPFVRNSIFKKMCTFTNDLDAAFSATHNMDALDFLKTLESESIDGVLFDPPYSPRQIMECYKGVGLSVHMENTQSSFYSEKKREIARIVKPNGIAICCGWNSGGIGETLGFDMEQCLLVPHGGAHNDTIVTLERKKTDLFSMS